MAEAGAIILKTSVLNHGVHGGTEEEGTDAPQVRTAVLGQGWRCLHELDLGVAIGHQVHEGADRPLRGVVAGQVAGGKEASGRHAPTLGTGRRTGAPAGGAPAKEELSPDDLDLDYYTGEIVDLESILREQIILMLPLKPLCDESCKGLCPHCGADLNLETCTCPADAVDSPFARLAKLKI